MLFTYPQRWSLLRLLRSQASTAADFERFVDPKPHTLKFHIDTRAKKDKAADLTAATSPEVKIFIGVTLMPPDKKERLVLPRMPDQAPELSIPPALAASQ